MTPVASTGSTALQVLQHSKPTTATSDKNGSGASDLVAIANGLDETSSTSEAETDYWDVLRVDITQMKLKLIERLGEEFGLKQEDFDSQQAFGSAIQTIVNKIKREDPIHAFGILKEIEKNLGLDKLGISLDTLITAVMEPGGTEDENLEAALGEAISVEEENPDTDQFGPDGIGLYSLVG